MTHAASSGLKAFATAARGVEAVPAAYYAYYLLPWADTD